MRNVLLAAVCLVAFPMLALACEIDGNRYRHGMRVSDLVTLDSDDKKAPACNIPNIRVSTLDFCALLYSRSEGKD